MIMDLLQFRIEVLRSCGAGDREIEELLVYNENVFDQKQIPAALNCIAHLDDLATPEPFLETWSDYAQEAEKQGAFATLQSHLIQFQFPIQLGISQTEPYRTATRRGIYPAQQRDGLKLQRADQLKLWIYPTPAGSIPVIAAGCREDFVTLVQAFVKRNEPEPIPESMGACIVSGYNNWDRIHRYKQQWLEHNAQLIPEQEIELAWSDEFKRVSARKELYQDRFILLSLGAYSNVPAAELELTDEQWAAYSLAIRLEHECTHYCTRRLLNSMRNNLLDELIADYMGIVAAIGYYRADWFLKFIGLESFPAYREGGRLENYRGSPTLSDSAFEVLQKLVIQAAENLEQFDKQYLIQKGVAISKGIIERTAMEKIAVLIALTKFTLEELACSKGHFLIEQAIAEVNGTQGMLKA
jgi:hypothetical protein